MSACTYFMPGWQQERGESYVCGRTYPHRHVHEFMGNGGEATGIEPIDAPSIPGNHPDATFIDDGTATVEVRDVRDVLLDECQAQRDEYREMLDKWAMDAGVTSVAFDHANQMLREAERALYEITQATDLETARHLAANAHVSRVPCPHGLPWDGCGHPDCTGTPRSYYPPNALVAVVHREDEETT